MPSKKYQSPFRGFSVEEVLEAESKSYVIQIGSDLYVHGGRLAFTRKSAVLHYNKIYTNLLDIINNGSEKQRKDAIRCLGTLKIVPLRIN